MVRRWPAAAAASSRSAAAVAASARRGSSLPGTATRSEGAQSGGATGRVLFTTTSRAAGSACVPDDGAVLEAAPDDAAALAEPDVGVEDGPAAGVPQPATSSASAASAARGRVRRMDQTFLSSTRVTSCCAFFVSTSRARPRVGRTFCSRFGPLMESQMDSAVA